MQSIHQVLREHHALIVHFSSISQMENIISYFPADLGYAIANQVKGGVCCSTMRPGDTDRNAFGKVGLILDLMTEDSLIAVSPGDGGACHKPDGTRDFDPKYKKFGLAELTASITDRAPDSHNEWGVQNYVVRGLFVLPPPLIVRTGHDHPIEIRLPDLYRSFPGQRVYSFKDSEIVELHPRSRIVRVEHSEIYR
jgi:hypothetical protein